MSKRKTRSPKSITRKEESIELKIKIYAFCEGKNTEPDYLMGFKELHGNGLVDVEPIRASGVPETIVNSAIAKKDSLDRIAKKTRDPLDECFEVWAIFDRDDHPKVPETLQKAAQRGIHVAYSNPCFEIWPMLHKQNQSAYIHRNNLQKNLEGKISGYKSKGSKIVCPIELEPNYEDALRRAIALEKAHLQVGTPMQNPYTDIHVLLERIKVNGKSVHSK